MVFSYLILFSIGTKKWKFVNVFHSLVADNRASSTLLPIRNSVVENEDNCIVESDDVQHESDLAYLYEILDKVFGILCIVFDS